MNDGLEYRLAIGRRFGERLARGDCVIQSGAEAFSGLPCTVSDGEIKSLSHVNALVVMQVMRDRGLEDPRFFSLGQIEAAGWKLADQAVGVGLQYLAMADDGAPVVKRFKVFHAGDVEGCGTWVRPEPVAREDVAIALERSGVKVSDNEAGLRIAIREWSRGAVEAAREQELARISYVVERDDDDDGTFVFARDTSRKDGVGADMVVGHLHVPDEEVRRAGWAIGDLGVWRQFRRRGIATEMVRRMAEHLGSEPTGAMSFFSEDGKKFWDHWARRGEVGQATPAAETATALRVALVATWLEAETGISGARVSDVHEVDRWQALSQTVIDDPLRLYAAVGDAERLVAIVLGQARAAQFERLEAEKNQAQIKDAGESMGDKKKAGKASAWVDKLFSQRQAVLAVPFKEKQRASALGAIWHPEKKLWFVPPNVDLAAFKEWNLGENCLGPAASEAMLIEDFARAMRDIGLIVPTEIKTDSQWHNVPVEHKKSNKSGSYLLNLQGGRDGVPCGSICNRLKGERFAWRFEGALLTPEQRAKMRAEAQAREWAIAREEKARHDVAAVHAREIWDGAAPGDGHGYVVRKGIVAEGVRQVSGARLLEYEEFIGESGKSAIRAKEMYALVPLMTEAGEVRSLQAISPDGKVKTFMRGAQKSGLMFVLGGKSLDDLVQQNCALLSYAEGMATGASFRGAVSAPMVVCFDAGNMEAVIKATAGRFPASSTKLLAVDNDQFHVERALEALAKTVGVNPYSKGGAAVEVVSRAGCDGLTGGARRQIALGDVVMDGEWHQGPKGTYCVNVEYETDGVSVRSLKVEMVPQDGKKISQAFVNRGAEVGKTAAGHAENCVVVTPWFESLEGRPTDWNDLMDREGVDVMRERIGDQHSVQVFNSMMMGQEPGRREQAAGVER